MKKNILPVLLPICFAIAGAGCSVKTEGISGGLNLPPENVVATVNGKPITKSAVKSLKTETAIYNKRLKVTEEQLINELINRELLSQQAMKHQLDQKAEVIDRIEVTKRTILYKSEMQDYMGKMEITPAEIEAEYQRYLIQSASDLIEYKASHIVLKSEQEAKQVIAQLNKGKNFSTLAKQLSSDPSASKGGELGWFNAKQMVPEFSSAINALKGGEYTQEPVRTGHGWHVILLEESRKKTPPAMTNTKERLNSRLKRVKFQKYIKALKGNSDIVIKQDQINLK